MTDFLPKEVQDELASARRRQLRKRATRSVHVGHDAFPILEFSEDGFAVDALDVPALRGLIDIFEGSRHLYQALIVASERDGDLMRYEFKRNTAAVARAPVDFEESPDRPMGLLPPA